MITTAVNLIALPARLWTEEPLKAWVDEALVSERRFRKGSNLEVERMRYSLFCQQIENYACRYETPSGKLDLGMDYLDALDILNKLAIDDVTFRSLSQEARFGATFTPPHLIPANLQALANLTRRARIENHPELTKRLQFICSLGTPPETGSAAYGLVEVHTPYNTAMKIHALVEPPGKTPSIDIRSTPLIDEDDDLSNLSDQENVLKNEIRKAIGRAGVVNFSNSSHIAITTTLHEFVYADYAPGVQEIRVVYNDGTEAAPFPLYCRTDRLNREEEARLWDAPMIRASLLSMRHPEQDYRVDFAWFVNQQASRPRSSAETDRFCYEKTLQQLDELGAPARLYIYQTGLQPAVVGFFRAVIHWMDHQSQRKVLVIPKFYRKKQGDYLQGDSWA